VYLGDDTDVDIKGAFSIGMQAILLDRNQKQSGREPRPNYYATDLYKAVEWILKNRG
jgi:FMN phosphatase YigB (HAD superfamily)